MNGPASGRFSGRSKWLQAMLTAALVLGLGWLAAPGWAAGQVDVYDFQDPALEARYRALIDEFRCPKCLNTNLSGSDAPIARDLRGTVYRLLVEEGMSDQQVRDFLQQRYGDFVLYNPPFKPGTWVLWLAPPIFVLLGLFVLFRLTRQGRQVAPTQVDQNRVDEIISELER